jgi:hypothetical protein
MFIGRFQKRRAVAMVNGTTGFQFNFCKLINKNQLHLETIK